jgi:hypothetical protein
LTKEADDFPKENHQKDSLEGKNEIAQGRKATLETE